MTSALLIIDPQNDFCHPDGSLFIPAAPEDCRHVVSFIQKNRLTLDKIAVLMDSHHQFDITHPLYWVDKNGNNPKPYTTILAEDVKNGTWKTSVEEYSHRTLEYLMLLEMGQRYNCCIWPPHCLIGGWGSNIESSIHQAIQEWERVIPGRVASYIEKGKNIFTEHYSAVRAEVPDPEDKETMTDMQLITSLRSCDTVYVAGEALSHCVAYSVRDLIEYIPIENIVLLKDTASNVPGFEHLGDRFLAEMQEKGMRIQDASETIL